MGVIVKLRAKILQKLRKFCQNQEWRSKKSIILEKEVHSLKQRFPGIKIDQPAWM